MSLCLLLPGDKSAMVAKPSFTFPSKGPLSWQTGMSSLSFRVGQEEHATFVIMSVNSEAAKESSKRRPRGSRQSLKHEALEIISLPEVPAVTPWLEGHNC